MEAEHGREEPERPVRRYAQNIYYAAKQIYKSLPNMAKATTPPDELRAAFEKHQTRHLNRER
jgi:ferritin-like metal-binding protein YciE